MVYILLLSIVFLCRIVKSSNQQTDIVPTTGEEKCQKRRTDRIKDSNEPSNIVKKKNDNPDEISHIPKKKKKKDNDDNCVKDTTKNTIHSTEIHNKDKNLNKQSLSMNVDVLEEQESPDIADKNTSSKTITSNRPRSQEVNPTSEKIQSPDKTNDVEKTKRKRNRKRKRNSKQDSSLIDNASFPTPINKTPTWNDWRKDYNPRSANNRNKNNNRNLEQPSNKHKTFEHSDEEMETARDLFNANTFEQQMNSTPVNNGKCHAGTITSDNQNTEQLVAMKQALLDKVDKMEGNNSFSYDYGKMSDLQQDKGANVENAFCNGQGQLNYSNITKSPTKLVTSTLSNGVPVYSRQKNNRQNSSYQLPKFELSKEQQLNTKFSTHSIVLQVRY